jgi:hypothetical protein
MLRREFVGMEFLRDPFWQSVGAVTAILALLLYVYVERDKISKLFTDVLTRLRSALGRLGNVSDTIMYAISSLLNVLLLSSLVVFILIVPLFLYKELIQHQSLYIDPFIIDSRSMIYGLIVIVWCLSIVTIGHKLTIDKLRDQIDYLNRIPGIQEIKNSYNRQLFDSVVRQWNNFSAELVNRHDDSPFAIDLAACSPSDVRDEILIIGCPNKVIHKRMNLKPRSSSTGYDEQYEAWKIDKEAIERIMKERFQVRQISYILEKQIKT